MNEPKTLRGQQTREQILRAAEETIAANGYTLTSIADITRAAGIAQGTFYIYFKSKEAVFRELVLEMGRMTRHALARVSAEAPNRLEAERVGLRAFLAFVRERPGLYRIVEEAKFVDPEAYRDYFDAFARSYEKRLEEAGAAGEIRPGDAEIRAWALMGMAKGLGERYALWDNGRPMDEVAETAFDLIEKGLRP
jgi:AcrR family transcriptional regulator